MIAFWREDEEYGFMSNFYKCDFVRNGKTFKSSEQAFMYEKALFFSDDIIAKKIMRATEPSEARKLGRKVANFDEEKWQNRRYDIMVDVLRNKFKIVRLKKALQETGNELLVEASPFDEIWGAKRSVPDAYDESKWRGENLLGKALMQVRDELVKS